MIGTERKEEGTERVGKWKLRSRKQIMLQAKKLRNGRGFDENLQNTGDQEMGAKQLLELQI